jgi:MFS family permease
MAETASGEGGALVAVPATAPPPRFLPLLVALLPLLATTAILVLGNGLFGTLLAVRMTIESVGLATIGVVLAIYSVGFVAGTLVGPRIVREVGHIRTFAAFAALGAATPLIHAFAVDPVLWSLLRLIAGFAMAVMFTVIESWFNGRAPNALRGQVMSTYMAVNYCAYGLSQMLILAIPPASFMLFSVVAILVALSLVPLALAPVETPQVVSIRRLSLGALIAISPLGVAGCFVVGLINAAFSSMGPVYAQDSLDGADAVATVMTVTILSGFVLQVPIGRLSDRFDRRQVILGLNIVMTVVSLLLAAFGALSLWLLFPLLALFGGLSATLYPLCLSHANDFMTPDQLVPAAAALLMWFGIGSVVGPIAASALMTLVGPWGLFLWTGLASAVLAAFTAYRMTRRTAKPKDEQGSFVAVPATSSSIVVELDPRGPGDTAARPADTTA